MKQEVITWRDDAKKQIYVCQFCDKDRKVLNQFVDKGYKVSSVACGYHSQEKNLPPEWRE